MSKTIWTFRNGKIEKIVIPEVYKHECRKEYSIINRILQKVLLKISYRCIKLYGLLRTGRNLDFTMIDEDGNTV